MATKRSIAAPHAYGVFVVRAGGVPEVRAFATASARDRFGLGCIKHGSQAFKMTASINGAEAAVEAFSNAEITAALASRQRG